MAFHYASRSLAFKASAVRELLKLTAKRDLITFGGGLPPNECFPIREIQETVARVLDEYGAAALQYSTTEGWPPLRTAIASRMRQRLGADVSADQLLVTTGSQQVLDLTGKVFLDEGDVVFCESPTYLAAISAFRTYGARFVAVPSDEHGMIIPELDRLVSGCDRRRLIYVVPDFQNPTGRTWSLDRRLQLIEVAERYNLPIVEDAPYRELRFEGEDLPPLAALDRSGHVIFTSTFSKIFAPGLRIGWVAAPASVVDKYVLAKQAADLHTSTFGQALVATFMRTHDIDAHILRIREVLRERRDAMVSAVAAHFPLDVAVTRPAGGLFLWAELPVEMDAHDWLQHAVAHGVAFCVGDAFYPDGRGHNAARLSFSDSTPARIVEGVKRLAAALHEVDTDNRLLWPAGASLIADRRSKSACPRNGGSRPVSDQQSSMSDRSCTPHRLSSRMPHGARR